MDVEILLLQHKRDKLFMRMLGEDLFIVSGNLVHEKGYERSTQMIPGRVNCYLAGGHFTRAGQTWYTIITNSLLIVQ